MNKEKKYGVLKINSMVKDVAFFTIYRVNRKKNQATKADVSDPNRC